MLLLLITKSNNNFSPLLSSEKERKRFDVCLDDQLDFDVFDDVVDDLFPKFFSFDDSLWVDGVL